MGETIIKRNPITTQEILEEIKNVFSVKEEDILQDGDFTFNQLMACDKRLGKSYWRGVCEKLRKEGIIEMKNVLNPATGKKIFVYRPLVSKEDFIGRISGR